MPNLLDSCLIERLPASVRQLAGQAGMSFPLSLRNFIAKAKCLRSRCIRVHFKFLPLEEVNMNAALSNMKEWILLMRAVFATADISVTVGSREFLVGPEFTMLLDPEVEIHGQNTPDLIKLYANRNHAEPNDIVIFFTHSIASGGAKGLANINSPNALVAFYASGYTVAHEVGHLLGLGHAGDFKEQEDCYRHPELICLGTTFPLMSTCGVCSPALLPILNPEEIAKIRASPRAFDCGG